MTQAAAESVGSKRCRLFFKKTSADISPGKLGRYFSTLPNPAILGGADLDSPSNRYSYFTAEPVEIFESPGDKDAFEKLRAVLNKYRIEQTDTQLYNGIFTGGWIGFFSYDLGGLIEKISAAGSDDLKLPLIRLCFYDKIICFDRLENCFYLFAIEFSKQETGEEKIAQLENVLEVAADCPDEPLLRPCDNFDIGRFKSNMTHDYYLDAIAKVKRCIYDGDVYQINFSQRFSTEFTAEAFKLFLWQNKFNPSPYSAYIDAGDYKIVSVSPELFISIGCHSRGSGNPVFPAEAEKNFVHSLIPACAGMTGSRIITTCPIKGTRPRTHNSVLDRENYAQLVASEKEKAELDMIIDLERNDLGRICEPGSIKVVKRRDIEAFSTVFHAISTISGKLSDGLDFSDCLKAIFPGGSITGAPKISAMNIINSLEPTARGIYTGSIGWLGLNGNACLNIAIRTIIIKDGFAFAQTGGGIVADSDPKAEWNETLVKAKALLAGIKTIEGK
jgi:para-aminobenzoate synthetase component 1